MATISTDGSHAAPTRRPDSRTRGALLICLLFVVGATGWYRHRQPEVTPVMQGKAIAERLGCLSCHGPGGRGGMPDPSVAGGLIPGWASREVQLYAVSDGDIQDWILLGEPRTRPAALGPSGAGLVPMPAYGRTVSPRELEDLVAYVRAVSGWYPGMPEAAYEDRQVAARLGCFACHGPSGMGGIGNPGSLKGHIPAWDGDEFGELVRDDAELREWILEGRIVRLWNDPLARRFIDAQVIQMPAYRELVSEAELDRIVAYVRWLRSR